MIPPASSASLFVQGCGVAAPLASILMTLSPLPTLLSIPRAAVVEEDQGSDDMVGLLPSSSVATSVGRVTISSLPLLPYSSMAVNGSLWMLYGFLLNARPLIVPNLVGACLAAVYVLMFMVKSSPLQNDRHVDLSRKVGPVPSIWTRVDLPSTFCTHLTVGGSILALGLTCYRGGMKNQLASLATLVCGVLFISPLAKVGSIIKSKSCPPGTIPLPFTIAQAANCFLWCVYGIKGVKDIAVTAPNVFGLFCAFLQGLVVILYSPKKKGAA